jgi:hypothetical protein
MLALILVIIVTVFSTYVSCSINVGEVTWLDYYQGGMVGLLASGIILQLSNKWRRVKELHKRSQSFMNDLKDWSDVILS